MQLHPPNERIFSSMKRSRIVEKREQGVSQFQWLTSLELTNELQFRRACTNINISSFIQEVKESIDIPEAIKLETLGDLKEQLQQLAQGVLSTTVTKQTQSTTKKARKNNSNNRAIQTTVHKQGFLFNATGNNSSIQSGNRLNLERTLDEQGNTFLQRGDLSLTQILQNNNQRNGQSFQQQQLNVMGEISSGSSSSNSHSSAQKMRELMANEFMDEQIFENLQIQMQNSSEEENSFPAEIQGIGGSQGAAEWWEMWSEEGQKRREQVLQEMMLDNGFIDEAIDAETATQQLQDFKNEQDQQLAVLASKWQKELLHSNAETCFNVQPRIILKITKTKQKNVSKRKLNNKEIFQLDQEIQIDITGDEYPKLISPSKLLNSNTIDIQALNHTNENRQSKETDFLETIFFDQFSLGKIPEWFQGYQQSKEINELENIFEKFNPQSSHERQTPQQQQIGMFTPGPSSASKNLFFEGYQNSAKNKPSETNSYSSQQIGRIMHASDNKDQNRNLFLGGEEQYPLAVQNPNSHSSLYDSSSSSSRSSHGILLTAGRKAQGSFLPEFSLDPIIEGQTSLAMLQGLQEKSSFQQIPFFDLDPERDNNVDNLDDFIDQTSQQYPYSFSSQSSEESIRQANETALSSAALHLKRLIEDKLKEKHTDKIELQNNFIGSQKTKAFIFYNILGLKMQGQIEVQQTDSLSFSPIIISAGIH